jgi:hypothetical protein
MNLWNCNSLGQKNRIFSDELENEAHFSIINFLLDYKYQHINNRVVPRPVNYTFATTYNIDAQITQNICLGVIDPLALKHFCTSKHSNLLPNALLN